MPCMCWYEPSDDDKKEFKKRCQSVVDYILYLKNAGDPLDCDVEAAKRLIEHLYTGKCPEKEKR